MSSWLEGMCVCVCVSWVPSVAPGESEPSRSCFEQAGL